LLLELKASNKFFYYFCVKKRTYSLWKGVGFLRQAPQIDWVDGKEAAQ